MKKRDNEWTNEERDFTAKTIIHHIKIGSTRLAAFEELSQHLKRTPAAIGFQWNKNIKEGYEEEIEEAIDIRLRNKLKQLSTYRHYIPEQRDVTMKDVIKYLRKIGSIEEVIEINERLLKENEALLLENNELKKELNKKETKDHAY